METHGNLWKPGFHASVTSNKFFAPVKGHPPVAFWAFMVGALAKAIRMGSGASIEKQALHAPDLSMLSALLF